tara:strand:- start:2875 stop:5502 length:2628 start_codon:yes stop_codon:yes gene_type:complete
MRNGKAFIRLLNNKLNKMLGGKFHFFEAHIGHEWWKDGRKIAWVEVDPDSGNKDIKSYDENGEVITIDGIIDSDVAKYIDGIKSGEVFKLSPKDIRWQKVQGEFSSTSERFPDAFLTSLLPLISGNAKLEKAYKDLESELLANAQINMNEVFKFKKDPRKLLRLLATDEIRSKLKGDPISEVITKILDGKIHPSYLLHPHNSRALEPQILNSLILENAIGGRRNNNGTHMVTRPDYSEDLKSKKHFIVGKGNTWYIQFVLSKIEEFGSDKKILKVLEDIKKSKGVSDLYLEILNKEIELMNLEVLVYRNPVNGVTSVEKLTLQKIDSNIEADEIVIHPVHGFQRMQFDFDGDTAVSYNLKSEKANNGLKDLLESDEYQSKITSMSLDIFEKNPQEGSIVNPSDWFKQSISNMQSKNAIGLMVSGRNVMNVVNYKDGKMTVQIWERSGGKWQGRQINVKARNPNSKITLKFAPLDNSNEAIISKSFLEEGETVVLSDGSEATTKDIKAGKKIYLKTTYGRMWEYLVQAAADDKKFQLLSKWGFDGTQAWAIRHAFYKIDSSNNPLPLTSKEAAQVAKVVRENFSTTDIAAGRNRFRNKVDPEGFFGEIYDRAQRLISDDEFVRKNQETIKNNTIKKRKRARLKGYSSNGKLTTREKIIKIIDDKVTESDENSILNVSNIKLGAVAQYISKNFLVEKLHPSVKKLLNKHNITAEDITGTTNASTFLSYVAQRFYAFHASRHDKGGKQKSTDKMYRYNEEVIKLQEMLDSYFNGDKNVKELIPGLDFKMTEKDRALFTYLFFAGIKPIIVNGKPVNYRTKLTHLPDSLLQEEMYDTYSNLWGEAYEESGDMLEGGRHMENISSTEQMAKNLSKKGCDI